MNVVYVRNISKIFDCKVRQCKYKGKSSIDVGVEEHLIRYCMSALTDQGYVGNICLFPFKTLEMRVLFLDHSVTIYYNFKKASSDKLYTLIFIYLFIYFSIMD